jgi:hypothetical protein
LTARLYAPSPPASHVRSVEIYRKPVIGTHGFVARHKLSIG